MTRTVSAMQKPAHPASHSPAMIARKRAKVAFFGIFGVRNLGNECTLQAILHNVRQRFPDGDIYSIAYEPDDTATRHSLTALPVTARHSRPDTGSAATAGQSSKLARLLRVLFRRLPAEALGWLQAIRLLRGTDMVVMTGTGMLTDYSNSCFGFPYDVWKWTFAAKLAGSRVRFVSVGVGPIYEALSRRFINSALAAADYRSFRDSFSRDKIASYGFNSGRDPVFPDLAFSLPREMFPVNAGHDNGRDKVVGVGLLNHADPRASRPEQRAASYEDYIAKMADFTSWLVRHGYRVRILQGDLRYDAAVKRDLRASLESRGLRYEEAGILDEEITSVDDLIRQISGTSVVVSPRFHNLVLGIMLGKPVISLSYDPKNDALLDGFGLGTYCQPFETFTTDTLIAQFTDITSKAREIGPLLRRRAEAYRSLLDQQYSLLFADLENGGDNRRRSHAASN